MKINLLEMKLQIKKLRNKRIQISNKFFKIPKIKV